MSKKPSLPKRTTWTCRLMLDVRKFHMLTHMDYTTLGRAAIKNPRFWERMLAGGTITLEKADEIYEYMASQGYHFNHEGDCHVERQR
jgi:hypothetical protein